MSINQLMNVDNFSPPLSSPSASLPSSPVPIFLLDHTRRGNLRYSIPPKHAYKDRSNIDPTLTQALRTSYADLTTENDWTLTAHVTQYSTHIVLGLVWRDGYNTLPRLLNRIR